MRVVFRGTIPAATKKAVCRIAGDLSKATEIRHRITVICVEAHKIQWPGSGFAAALFKCPEPLQIYVACVGPPGMSLHDWHGAIAGLVAHELAHYEQFRDGLKMQERGVAARAKRILRDAGYRLAK